MSKILTVFGATGQQGGSVVRAVLADPALSKKFSIRAVTRDANKPASKALASLGAQVVYGDMSSPHLVAPALQGSHTVFLMTNYWELLSKDAEIRQGKAVADAAAAAGVEHLIFSSLMDVRGATRGRLSRADHFDGKAEVERHIRAGGVPATFFVPGVFMGSLLDLMMRDEEGLATLALPVDGDTAKVPLFDVVGDTGKYVKAAIKTFPTSTGKHLLGSPEYLSPKRLISEYSQATGRPAKFVQLAAEAWKAAWLSTAIAREISAAEKLLGHDGLCAVVAQELLETFQLMDDVGYYGGRELGETLALLDEKPTSWKEFVERNQQRWL